VSYSTTSGTASNADYVPISGTLTFDQGEAAKIIYVPLIDNINGSGEKTFFFNISNATNAQLINPTGSTVTIYR
jgi:hypothetical protein